MHYTLDLILSVFEHYPLTPLRGCAPVLSVTPSCRVSPACRRQSAQAFQSKQEYSHLAQGQRALPPPAVTPDGYVYVTSLHSRTCRFLSTARDRGHQRSLALLFVMVAAEAAVVQGLIVAAIEKASAGSPTTGAGTFPAAWDLDKRKVTEFFAGALLRTSAAVPVYLAVGPLTARKTGNTHSIYVVGAEGQTPVLRPAAWLDDNVEAVLPHVVSEVSLQVGRRPAAVDSARNSEGRIVGLSIKVGGSDSFITDMAKGVAMLKTLGGEELAWRQWKVRPAAPAESTLPARPLAGTAFGLASSALPLILSTVGVDPCPQFGYD